MRQLIGRRWFPSKLLTNLSSVKKRYAFRILCPVKELAVIKSVMFLITNLKLNSFTHLEVI